ncbi:MAG TPA: IS5 family transposase [Pirellulales bacterium]|nr:IS5 family transposase [Pirellulales bacterium]
MADACMPERFYELALPILPPEKEVGPEGGRRPKGHYTVLKVIWFVLVTGCRWKDVPKEMGCCGETARTRMQGWEVAGIWGHLHKLLLTMLNHEKQLHLETVVVDTTHVRAYGGGESTGPSPVDRRKKRTKFTLLVDRDGVPLVIHAGPANRSDQVEILPAVLDFPKVGGKPGRPLTHPKRLYADAGFDCEATRVILRWLGIDPHIRHRHGDHGSHLGRVRWVVERTISWIKGLRRMRYRYDRSQTSIDAWTSIAAAVVCLQIVLEAV